MPTLNSSPSNLTLVDWSKRLSPDGKVDKIVEILDQTNPALRDIIWKEGNLPTGHKTTIRTGLPNVAWRKLYEGVQPSRSTTAQITDSTGMLESYSVIDKDLADLNGNTESFRISESQSFFEAMSQEMAQTLIYGNASAEPAKFTGLALRYSELPGANSAKSSQNVIDAGGTTGNLTSIYLVGWGDNSIHGIFPKGSKAGLSFTDHGHVTVDDGKGGYFEAYRAHIKWNAGLTVRDWRYGVRICNISIADLEALIGTQALSAKTSIIKLMSRAIDRLPNIDTVSPVFYVSRTLYSLLKIAAMEKTSNVLSIEAGLNQFGKRSSEVFFDGVPIRKMDKININESVVVAAP